MKNIFRNSFSGVFLLAVLIGFSSCQKDTISPPNQSTAFVKYYGHVASQVAADLLRTSDGGYILLGGTNSYTSGEEKDIFVVKTDSLGNEMWSSSFGKASVASSPTSGFRGDYLRFDEVGVRLAELPDGSMYTLACNRTYVVYPDASSTIGTRGETKVVLYQIDAATGAPTTTDGVELHSETADTLTESVADMKLDSSSGVIKYILTGYTTNVPTNKATIPGNDNTVSDRSDIFTVALDETFNITWTSGNQKYGRIGTDYGVSVHILGQNYLVCGTIDRNYAGTAGGIATTYEPYSDMLAVFMDKVTGQPTNPNYYGEEGTNFRGGQSVYNPTTGRITIFGYVEQIAGRTNNVANLGKLAMVQIDEGGSAQSINGSTLTYLDVNGRAGQFTPFTSSSIAEIPDNEGYILSATYEETTSEHDIYIIKVDQNFDIATGWPYAFGFNEVTVGGVFATKEQAGTVIPVTEAIAGTSQSKLTGYAFTGTFGLGTNDMLGLVKINTNGDFKPE